MAFNFYALLRQLSVVVPSLLLVVSRGVDAAPTGKVNGTSYDYVIVGGGLSGLVVANRLTEDPTSMPKVRR